MNSEPPPFGDPGNIRQENADAVKKGIAFGCGGCLTVIMGGVALILGLGVLVLFLLRNSDPTQMSFQAAQQSEVCQRELGEPMSLDWPVLGSINYVNGAGQATVSVPVSGPKGSLNIQTKAAKSHGTWKVSEMTTVLSSGEAVSLLPAPPEPGKP